MEEDAKVLHKGLDEALIKTPELPRDTLGRTYFVKFYGFDRLWILPYVASGLATPAVRYCDEQWEGPHRRFDNMVWADLLLCMLGLVLVLSLVRAVDSRSFVHFHSEHGRQPNEFWAPMIKALALANLLRPLAPLTTGDTRFSGYSHVGGIFEVSTMIVALPFGIEVYGMCIRAARKVVREIEGTPDEGKWVRVLRMVQRLRAETFALWSFDSAALPWCTLIVGGLIGAYSNGVLFLTSREPQRVCFFFVYIALLLAVLQPLASITTACGRQINSAATKWYPLQEFGDIGGTLPTNTFQAYTLVLRFLDKKFMGVCILGFPITQNELRGIAFKALLGLPSIFGALEAFAQRHEHAQSQIQIQSQSG